MPGQVFAQCPLCGFFFVYFVVYVFNRKGHKDDFISAAEARRSTRLWRTSVRSRIVPLGNDAKSVKPGNKMCLIFYPEIN